MKRRVLITNHSSSMNLGDAALLSSTMAIIKETAGNETEFSVITNNPFGILHDGRTKILFDPILAPVYLKTSGNLLEVVSPRNLRLLTSFVECDAIVVRGGDALSSVYGNLSLLARVLESYPSVLLNKPLAFLGHTFEPLNAHGLIDSCILRLLKKELDLASFVTVRESKSLVRLEKLGIDGRKTFIAPDLAFKLQGSKKCVAEKVLNKVLHREHRSIIGVTSSYSLYYFFNKSNNRGDYCSYVAKLLDKIVNDFDVEVILLPHSFIPGKDDRLVTFEIYNHCLEKASIHPLHEVLSPELAKAIIGCFDMLISFGRLHPIIHSVSQAIPCMGIDYSQRMDGLFDSLEMSDCSIKLERLDANRFMKTFGYIWSHRNETSMDLQEKMKLVDSKSKRTKELLKSFLI